MDKYYSKKKLTVVGANITVVFERPEAVKFLNLLSQASMEVSEDINLEKMFYDILDRFELKYKEVIPF